MEGVVIVLRDSGGNQQAASYTRGIVEGCISPRYLVVPADLEIEVDAAREVAATLWGGEWTVRKGPVVQVVDECIHDLAEGVGYPGSDPAEVVHVLQSDTMVSPLWRSLAAQGCTQWPVIVPGGSQFAGGQYVKLPDGVQGFAGSCEAAAGLYAGGRFLRVDVPSPEVWAVNSRRYRELGGLDAGMQTMSWALRDLALRIRDAGQAVMLAPGVHCFIADPDRIHPHAQDPTGRLAYYRKHADRTVLGAHKLTALWIVKPASMLQLHMLRDSIRSVAGVVDSFHLVLTDHPGRFEEGDGPEDEGLARRVERMAEPDDIAKAAQQFRKWVGKVVRDLPTMERVTVDVVTSWPTLDALEQLISRRMAESGATWCLRMTEADQIPQPVTRDDFVRLMRHPDPMVTAYNLGISWLWGSRTLVREDPPFGDGGTLRGDQAGTNDWRLYRTNGPRLATDGGRVANLRLQNVAVMDPGWRKPGVTIEGMRCSEWSRRTSIGLYMLAYSGEDPDDLGRWLDWSYGLATRQVVVWTDAEPIDTGLHGLMLDAFSAERVDGPTATDFAAWRNAGLAILDAPVTGGCEWIWTVDPDEWVEHPVADLMAVRRMAESHRHVYLFGFDNLREGRVYNESTAVRMHRAALELRYVGLVHETFDDQLSNVRRVHGPHSIGQAPFRTRNMGTADPEAGQAKAGLYQGLIRQELERRPHRSQPWILLGYEHAAMGAHGLAAECFRRAVACAGPDAYLAHHEAAMQHLRQAKGLLQVAVARLPEGAMHHAGAVEMLRSLQGLPDPMPDTDEDLPPLPEFPGAEVRG